MNSIGGVSEHAVVLIHCMFQLNLWDLQFFYVDYDGSFVAFHANTLRGACTYVQNRFRGRAKAYLYVWHRQNLSLDNFPFKNDGEIKQEIVYK